MTFILFFTAFVMVWGITCWTMIKTGFIHLHSKIPNETIHLNAS
ncbi:MAG: hypothetical protein O7F74_05955 [Bacteroidetes bacterium]|nr:hypothetical protein [Bacteroidota bacterium]